MKNDMIASGIHVPSAISSFGLESLLWNVANGEYIRYVTLRYKFDEVIKYLDNNKSKFDSYKEANGIKNLFTTDEDLRSYQDFITKLSSFFEYDIIEA